MKLTNKQLLLNAIFCSALLGVVIWALYAEYDRPWKMYQKQFRQLNTGKSAQGNPAEISQIWNQELGTIDRCVTCHEGIANPLFVSASQPFKTHSGNYLKNHPVEKFGCVICHEGQGPALTADDAHGEVKNWTKPVLRGAYAQSSCAKCHLTDQGPLLKSDLQGAPVYTEGRRLFNKYNCVGCHTTSLNKRPDYIAPVLTSIGSKVNREWLVKWVKNPTDYLPDAKMPKFNLSDEEIGYMADYLISLVPSSRGVLQSAPTGNKRSSDELTAIEGKTLVLSLGCLGCHLINGTGNNFAPDLSDIGNKVNAGWLVDYFNNPKVYQPKTTMPNLKIDDGDIQSIVDYLVGLKVIPANAGERHAVPLRVSGQSGNNIEKGRTLIKQKGCTGCHEIDNIPAGFNTPPLDGIGDKRVDELAFGNIINIKKTLTDWMLLKVKDPGRFATDRIVTMMPNYNFDQKQAEALVTYLLSLRKDTVPPGYKMTYSDIHKPGAEGKSLIDKYNCRGCHVIESSGGTTGPDLTMEAKRSRPEWLFSFLKRPYKIRPFPMLKAGMPDFNLPDSEVNSTIEYLSSMAEEPYPYNFEAKKEIGPENIWNGEKLYREIFACSGCHTVSGHGGQVGPDHTDLASRLKREWIRQWLENPQAVKPDVSMPRFKFRDWELEALTDYLMTLGGRRFVDIKNTD